MILYLKGEPRVKMKIRKRNRIVNIATQSPLP